MPRQPSYNQLVARSRAALVIAAQSIHESFREITAWDGAVLHVTHRGCCSTLTRVDAPPLARAHFARMFAPRNPLKAECYWFGDPDDKPRRRSRNLAKRDKRVTALLLAAASLD